MLIRPDVAQHMLSFDFPLLDTGVDTVGEMALSVIAVLYILAALFNLYIPDTGVEHKVLKKNPIYLIHEFNHCLGLLWRDRLGQSSMLQGVVAVGVAVGAIAAAKYITLRKSVRVIPLGIAMGLIVLAMNFVHEIWLAVPLLILIGGLSGFFVVPMNALLQHRGHILMGAGHSIAVQNFNENLSILIMTSTYSVLLKAQLSIYWIIVLFGLFVAGTMWLVKRRHEANQRERDDVAHLEDVAHH